MKKQIAFVGLLTVAVLSPAFAAEKPLPPWKIAMKLDDELGRKKCMFEQIIDELEKLRAEAPCSTDAYARAYIDSRIVLRCRRPSWINLKQWTLELEKRIPRVVRRDLDDPAVSSQQKVELAGYLAEYLAGEKDFKGAESVLRTTLAAVGEKERKALAAGHLALSDVYRWQDRFDEAWGEIDKAAEFDVEASIGKAFSLANGDGSIARAEKLAEKIEDVSKRLAVYERIKKQTEESRKLALAFVLDGKNDLSRRCAVALGWFGTEKTPEHAAAFSALNGVDKKAARLTYEVNSPINQLYAHADWAAVLEIFETFDGVKFLADPRLQRLRILCLALSGRKNEALAALDLNLTNAAFKPVDKVKFEVTKALLTGGDAEKAIAAAKFERKDEVAVTLTAARQALMLGLNDAAERLSAKHSTFFVDFPQRTLKVAWSKTPIDSVGDWRKISDTLDRQLCDRKWGANLDALETDVASGRKTVEKTALDSKDVEVEVSSVCDVKGLHIFLRVQDPKARAVEEGFAGGVGMEMYFAPGKYEPYICFGADPRLGVESAFQTRYTNARHRRIDVAGVRDRRAFRSETIFSDEDYVQHLFFAWDMFYQKLPKDGSKWRFECLAFLPKGVFSFGGSANVHNSSKWCDLEFALDDAAITAIRRRLVCRHVKSWNKVGSLERFDKWADAEIGDPEFYEKVLKPVEDELKGYAQMVKVDMTDKDVNLVYEKGLVRWLGISHEIDDLRREWLLEKTCKGVK